MLRLKISHVGLAVVAGLALAASATAQQPPQPLSVKQLKPDVYWTQGGAGGNTGIIIGKTGVIVVDAKTTPESAKEMLAEIAKLTPKPVTHVIITHSDGDHVNGLAGFPSGLTIIAHEGNKKEQEKALAAGGRGAPPADRLPNHVVTKNKEALTIDGVKVELYHWAPAHTSGDLIVYFPSQKVAFTGDVMATNRPDPNIHPEKNGSTEGWITTVKGIAALNAEQFVPGHGDVQTKAFVQERLKNTEEKRRKVAAMIKEGKSLPDIKTALNDQTGGAPTYIDVAYAELTKK